MSIIRYEAGEGGDGTPLLPYLFFHGNIHYPRNGVEDLLASADTLEELKSLPETQPIPDDAFVKRWYQIVEKDTLKILEEVHFDEDGWDMVIP